jgi:hypothetical protein
MCLVKPLKVPISKPGREADLLGSLGANLSSSLDYNVVAQWSSSHHIPAAYPISILCGEVGVLEEGVHVLGTHRQSQG